MSQRSYSLGLYEKAMPNNLDWSEKLIAAKTAGFDFVEISIDETPEKMKRLEMSTDARLKLLDQMARSGIRIETMCLSGHRKYPLGSPDQQTRDRSMEIMEKAILLARDLGIRIIQIAGYDTFYDQSTPETQKWFAQGLAMSVKLAAKYGILLAFENMETEFINTVAKAMNWVSLMASPYLAVYPDTGNVTNAVFAQGSSVLDDFATGEGHIAAVHLKESVPGKFREIPFGTGHVNFHEIIQKTYSMGVRRYVAEFWYNSNQNWEKDLTDANCFFRRIFAGLLIE